MFGVFGPKLDDKDLESEKIDIATGGTEDIKDIPPLESEENAAKKQGKITRKGLKILTQQQMITRLPILLAQLKAGNNIEIRQIVYSLYRSKKIIKNNL